MRQIETKHQRADAGAQTCYQQRMAEIAAEHRRAGRDRPALSSGL